ncbi:hypothetical protein E2562_010601 [Oryza meyeriana var. granulata]|uniref:Uncharacterized protein n=1 Tax=Oryza meyeriana var. granulata TaxID=110450 RepID=A0A6G1BUN9_9ORYZ|nr:hypothetical protein E2562_010601 [Oryza meyeriana var. granulata]
MKTRSGVNCSLPIELAGIDRPLVGTPPSVPPFPADGSSVSSVLRPLAPMLLPPVVAASDCCTCSMAKSATCDERCCHPSYNCDGPASSLWSAGSTGGEAGVAKSGVPGLLAGRCGSTAQC